MADADSSYGFHMRAFPFTLIAAIVAAMMVGSCSDNKGLGSEGAINPETSPTMLTRDVSTLISDSGYTRYHITSDTWLMFENRVDAYWKFPDGLYLEKYDDDMNVDASIVCDSATYFSAKKLWRLDGNVRMKNTAGDRFLTQQLFWDQDRRTIYSDSFIHIERATRIIEGYGFTSNEQMTNYVVNRPSGIFPIPERDRQNRDSITSENKKVERKAENDTQVQKLTPQQ